MGREARGEQVCRMQAQTPALAEKVEWAVLVDLAQRVGLEVPDPRTPDRMPPNPYRVQDVPPPREIKSKASFASPPCTQLLNPPARAWSSNSPAVERSRTRRKPPVAKRLCTFSCARPRIVRQPRTRFGVIWNPMPLSFSPLSIPWLSNSAAWSPEPITSYLSSITTSPAPSPTSTGPWESKISRTLKCNGRRGSTAMNSMSKEMLR